MINEDVRKTFRLRSAVTNYIRRYLQETGVFSGHGSHGGDFCKVRC